MLSEKEWQAIETAVEDGTFPGPREWMADLWTAEKASDEGFAIPAGEMDGW